MLAALASELLPAATRGVLASQAATCSSIVGSSSSSTWSRALSGLSASTSSSAPAPAGAAAAEQQLEAHARALGLVGGIGGSGGVSGLPFALPEHEIEDGEKRGEAKGEEGPALRAPGGEGGADVLVLLARDSSAASTARLNPIQTPQTHTRGHQTNP